MQIAKREMGDIFRECSKISNASKGFEYRSVEHLKEAINTVFFEAVSGQGRVKDGGWPLSIKNSFFNNNKKH